MQRAEFIEPSGRAVPPKYCDILKLLLKKTFYKLVITVSVTVDNFCKLAVESLLDGHSMDISTRQTVNEGPDWILGKIL